MSNGATSSVGPADTGVAAQGSSRRRALALLLLVATVGVHWPGARADFSLDDDAFVVRNASIRSLGDASAALLAPFPPEQRARGLFRPVTSFSYALDYRLAALDPLHFHRSNTLIYALSMLLVFGLARRHLRSDWSAFAASLIFALHPVHCEAVDSISGRSELLALLFSLAALLAFIRAHEQARRRRWLALSLLCYALACGSKETGAVLPAVLLVYAAVAGTGAPLARVRRAALRVSIFFGVFAAYLALRLAVLGSLAAAARQIEPSDFATRLHTTGATFLEYLRLLVFPNVLQTDFYYESAIGMQSDGSLRSWLGIALLAAFVALAAISFALALRTAGSWRQLGRAGSAAAALALFLVFLAPVTHFVDVNAVMAERFLFAPSLGFVILVVLGAEIALQGWRPRPALRALLAGALVLAIGLPFALRARARAADWRDAPRLWNSAIEASPSVVAVHTNLVVAHLERDELGPARVALERVEATAPNDYAVVLNRAVLLEREGDPAAGLAILETLSADHPDDFFIWYNRGRMQLALGNASRAIEPLERAAGLNPNYAEARETLEQARERVASAQKFIEQERRRVERSRAPKLYEMYARACQTLGDDDCAQRYRRRAARTAAKHRSDESGESGDVPSVLP